MTRIATAHWPRCALAAAVVFALSPAQIAAQDEPGLEEIVVTAERVAADLQDVPVAVTALSADELLARNVSRIDDVAASVPNLVIRENTGLSNGASFFLRGIGEDDSRIGADPAVGVYIDDQYYGRALGGMLDLVDIERVEVLRGPQGTLYGRNSNGGAVKIYTRRPDENGGLDAEVGVGSFNRRNAKLRWSGELADGWYSQAAIASKRRDGFYDGPGVDDSLGEEEKLLFLAGLRHVGENWEWNLKVDHSQDRGDPNFSVPTDAFFDLPGDVIVPASFGNPAITDGNLFQETDISGVTMHVSGQLGDVDFNSITGYRNTDNELLTAIRFFYTQDVEYTTYSQEFQLSGDTEAFNWVGGLYFYREDSEQDTFFLFAPTSLAIDARSVAAYGQVGFDLTDRLSATIGGRFTDEEKDADGQALSFGGTLEMLNDVSESDSNFDFKVGLDFELTDGAMIYGSVATGNKAFGWSNDDLGFVDTEEVTTYELGLRSQLADNRLRFNATAFFNDYEDLQLNGTTAAAAFSRFNADEVETSGIEFEVAWAPTDAIRVDAAFGFQGGEYQQLSDSVLPAFVASSISEALGRELKNLPERTARVGITSDTELEDGSSLTFSADYSYASGYFTLLANNPESRREGTGLLGGRITWRSPDERYHFSLFGKNLTDEEYIVSAVGPTQYPGAPFQVGVDFGIKLF